MEIGFYSHVYRNLRATQGCLESIRKFYPSNPIVISCDGGEDYSYLCTRYNATYFYNKKHLGYPTQPYGFRVDDALEWLDRMYRAVLQMNTEYFIMMEDDVLLVKKITIDKNWDMAGQPMLYEGQVPLMPEPFLDIIEKYSGVRPKQNYYNCGGGSIFKTSTFLNNYESIRVFLTKNMDKIQTTIYPTLGWLDCLLCVFFLLCGKQLNENKRLYNNFPLQRPFKKEVLTPEIEIVHNYKDLYD